MIASSTRRPPGSTRSRAAGFTLLEVTFATVVVAIALSGAVAALFSSMKLERVNDESATATLAARRVLEEIQDEPIATIYATFGRGAALGSFAVPGLEPDPNDPDGVVGAVQFPEQQNVLGMWELREDFVDAGLGMPLDLDRDTNIDNLDHSGDYLMLPVRVQVRWSGVSGPRTVELVTILSRR